MKTYATYASAERRASYLAKNYGICTGVIKNGEGRYYLAFNPDEFELEPMILV